MSASLTQIFATAPRLRTGAVPSHRPETIEVVTAGVLDEIVGDTTDVGVVELGVVVDVVGGMVVGGTKFGAPGHCARASTPNFV